MSILAYLETFTAVVDKGSFAAEALGISRPVISKLVSSKVRTFVDYLVDAWSDKYPH